MKIQKGVLSDSRESRPKQSIPAQSASEAGRTSASSSGVEKDRLFETLEKEQTSNRSYAKILAVAILLVVIAGVVIFYLTLPKPGDTVRAPKGLEQAVRDHLQEKQRRDATDITFYYCGPNSYWARAGVEIRKDIPNPVYKIGTYAVTARGTEEKWDLASRPISTQDDDRPCS